VNTAAIKTRAGLLGHAYTGHRASLAALLGTR
jgi:hypothetical protein